MFSLNLLLITNIGEPFIEVSSDSTVLVGSNVTLVCSVHLDINSTQTSTLLAKWSGPNLAHTTEATCTETVTTGNTVMCQLTLKSVEESSGGKYTCDGYAGHSFLESTELHVGK